MYGNLPDNEFDPMVTGYLADVACVERRWAPSPDNADMRLGPGMHTVSCMLMDWVSPLPACISVLHNQPTVMWTSWPVFQPACLTT